MADEKTEEEQIVKDDFVHLHVHSDYSLLDGAGKIGKLIARAKELGMSALALTDHGNMFGSLRFEQQCHAAGINPLVGCEFYVAGGSRTERKGTEEGNKYYHLILIAKNQTGYKNLSWLTSKSYTEGMYYKPRIDWELLQQYHEGLICCTACIAGQLPQLLLAGKTEEAEKMVQDYSALFGPDHFYIELQKHNIAEEDAVAPKLIAIARKFNVPMVVTNDIHYIMPDDAEAQDVLVCIGRQKKLSEEHGRMPGDPCYYMKTGAEMAALFPDMPELVANTRKIADMCDLTIHQYKTQELKDCLPVYQLPEGFETQDDYVRYLVEEGLKKRYGVITDEIRKRAEYELGIIFSMGFSGYFLIVWNFINWSKTHDIPIGPGRGSGAGSLVAYAMTITDIDPFRYKLIFERFLNPERVSMPDFDVDMCERGRQDVIQYTRDHYGDPQVGHIVTFGTLKAKAVLADVGRVLGIPLAEVNALKKCIPEGMKVHLKDAFTPPDEKHTDWGQLIPYKDDERYKKLFELCFKLEDCNRNTSLHASGIVIGRSELPNWAPVYKDGKTGKVAVQYTMDIIEPCGLVKMDYLGLKTLTLIKHCERIIRKRPEYADFKAENVSETDEKTFDLFCRGDTVAVFQFESPGMQKILRDAQPRKLEELVALNALYRPGPMDYIPQYIEGKKKPETIHYPDPSLEDILKETYGVMVYQEQVMQVAQKIAGFSLGGADMLRRAMGKKKKEVLDSKKVDFIEGAVKNGHTAEHAAEIFEIMVPFAGYGFNKSHAAAYSVVAYRTAYLKANFKAEFMAANLINEIKATDKLKQYIAEARAMGISVDPPDINRSDILFDVVDGRIVYGLQGVAGVGEGPAEEIVAKRQKDGPYKDFMDFLNRVDLHCVNKKTLEALIKTGAFDCLEPNRAMLLMNMERAVAYADKIKESSQFGQISLFEDAGVKEFSDFVYESAPEWSSMEKLAIEKEMIGFYISGHPLDEYRTIMEKCATVTSSNISRIGAQDKVDEENWKKAHGGGEGSFRRGERRQRKKQVAVGMVQELRSLTTKKGSIMAFGKLADFDGSIDLTFFPAVWEKLQNSIHNDAVIALGGSVDGTRDTPSFLVDEILDVHALQERTVQEVHIKLNNSKCTEMELANFRDFLFGYSGNCSVYFHIETPQKQYTVKSGVQYKLPGTDDFLAVLKEQPAVSELWTA